MVSVMIIQATAEADTVMIIACALDIILVYT